MTQRLVGLLMDMLVAMGYSESLAMRWMPGGGGHFSALKVSQVMPRDIS